VLCLRILAHEWWGVGIKAASYQQHARVVPCSTPALAGVRELTTVPLLARFPGSWVGLTMSQPAFRMQELVWVGVGIAVCVYYHDVAVATARAQFQHAAGSDTVALSVAVSPEPCLLQA
jgi:hypothetical protein